MTTPREMSWPDAVMEVIRSASEPLHYTEITSLIGESGLRTLTGVNPAYTVRGALSALEKDEQVARTGRGLFALPTVAKVVQQEADAAEADAEAAAENPDRLTVKAYGLYWDRGVIDWRKPQLWGQQNENSKPVNFADQDGIYTLHKGSEIVYVGQTLTDKAKSGLYHRLNGHRKEARKADRWDAFSWYGFKPVDDNGDLLPVPREGSVNDVINTIEAMFIEALMPRLNMQGGPGSRELRDGGLYTQSVIQNRWGQ